LDVSLVALRIFSSSMSSTTRPKRCHRYGGNFSRLLYPSGTSDIHGVHTHFRGPIRPNRAHS
jgi:hypothetical protein